MKYKVSHCNYCKVRNIVPFEQTDKKCPNCKQNWLVFYESKNERRLEEEMTKIETKAKAITSDEVTKKTRIKKEVKEQIASLLNAGKTKEQILLEVPNISASVVRRIARKIKKESATQ